MNITREIVKDLLPLYAAGEASEESRAAVEEWLRTDPELPTTSQPSIGDFLAVWGGVASLTGIA